MPVTSSGRAFPGYSPEKRDRITVGVGARHGVTAAEVGAVVDAALDAAGVAAGDVWCLATADAKAGERGILDAAAARGWPVVAYTAAELATVDVPNPSERVSGELGTASVAEAAALYGGGAELLVPKLTSAVATVAVARHRNQVVVVGIGADGWRGLGEDAREAVASADVLIGSGRQLTLIPDEIGAERVPWPSPLVPALPGLLDAGAGRATTVLASGDPMFYGVGAVLVRLLGAERVHVIPHPSSVSLACARLGWPTQDVDAISAVGRPIELLHTVLHPGRRVLVLSADATTPAAVVDLLERRGYGESTVQVLENLGGADERITGPEDAGDLNIVAIECRGAALLPIVPGLPDDVYDHDGQLTKREVRAITLARLAPIPGQLLWDVGAGAGSIAIEWARTHRTCRAIAVELSAERTARIEANAANLGVPGIQVVAGYAPEALDGLDAPDAVFIGGGVTVPGVLNRCWDALKPGGRLVVNAVTIESEQFVIAAWNERGGDLTKIAIGRAAPMGGFTVWRPALPVTQWMVVK